MFLSETLANSVTMHNLCSYFGYHDCFVIPCNGRQGGLCIVWQVHLKIQVIVANQNLIHVCVLSDSTPNHWMFTGIYGPPHQPTRKYFGENLANLIPPHDLPWLLMGDFNDITCQEEK